MVRNRPLILIRPDVLFGSKADMIAYLRDVCFTLESGHSRASIRCPLCANSGHCPGYVSASLATEQHGFILKFWLCLHFSRSHVGPPPAKNSSRGGTNMSTTSVSSWHQPSCSTPPG